MHFQNKRILNAHWVFLLGVGIRLKLPFFYPGSDMGAWLRLRKS